jgi:hypothetical protein
VVEEKDRGIRIFEADLSDDTAIQSIISAQSKKHLHYVFEKLWIVTKFYFKRRHRRRPFLALQLQAEGPQQVVPCHGS